MPSIIPGYVYTLFACMAVGTLLILASSMSIAAVKNRADLQKLRNLGDSVATKALEITSQAKTQNLTVDARLDVPVSVGNQRYWLRLGNDSSSAWIDIGFGTQPTANEQRISIPAMIAASGTFVSGTGIPRLRCRAVENVPLLELGCS